LVEALLSVAVIGILAGMSAPVYEQVISRNNIEIAASTLAGTLRRAQILSQGAEQDSGWGVKLESGSITLFRGANFASRDPAYDEIYNVSPSITLSGINELSFSKLFGAPSAIGNISLTNPSNETKIISINSKGTVSY
jgi:Tfp pilus assembly protein FimT